MELGDEAVCTFSYSTTNGHVFYSVAFYCVCVSVLLRVSNRSDNLSSDQYQIYSREYCGTTSKLSFTRSVFRPMKFRQPRQFLLADEFRDQVI